MDGPPPGVAGVDVGVTPGAVLYDESAPDRRTDIADSSELTRSQQLFLLRNVG